MKSLHFIFYVFNMREELITPRSNPIKKYFADVTKYPLLTVDEEVELFRKFNQSE